MPDSPSSTDGAGRNPRLAFNADEADCCTCVATCDRRGDGICRCLVTAEEASRERTRVLEEALEGCIQGYEWAYNDACFTAPEDRDRQRRQWQVLLDRVEKARASLAAVAVEDGEPRYGVPEDPLDEQEATLAAGPPHDPEPCDYCKQKGREWTPDCEKNKALPGGTP